MGKRKKSEMNVEKAKMDDPQEMNLGLKKKVKKICITTKKKRAQY
jgi:hypothetical protein